MATTANDADQDFLLKQSVPIIFPTAVLVDSDTTRGVCNSGQVVVRSYRGDTAPDPFDWDPRFPDITPVRWALEMDAQIFASR